MLELRYKRVTNEKMLKLRLPLVEIPSKLKMLNIQLLVVKIGRICSTYRKTVLAYETYYIFQLTIYKSHQVENTTIRRNI